MSRPFIGSEALAAGEITRGKLRWSNDKLLPRVYVPKGVRPTLLDRIVAAWLRTKRTGIIAGRAAAALHGANWVDRLDPIEIIGRELRHKPGMIVRSERIAADEIVQIRGLPVTSVARTAWDLGRHLARNPAVARLDALAAATSVTREAVLEIAGRYPGARGSRRARLALALMDPGAQSPRESWLRLVLFDAGLPKPRTQIMVCEEGWVAYLDLGWDEPAVGMDYDGEHHFNDRKQMVRDIGRYAMIERQGWVDLRVVREHTPKFIEHRVRAAFAQRGYSPDPRPKWF